MESRLDAGDGPAVRIVRVVNAGQTQVDRPRDGSPDQPELRMMLDPTLEAAGLARQALREWAPMSDLDAELTEDLLDLVSELVANAARHARSPSEVIVTLDDEVVRVEVHDLAAAPPVVRPRDAISQSSGMRMVAETADRWGWRPTATGKFVWTENDRPDRGARTDGRGEEVTR